MAETPPRPLSRRIQAGSCSSISRADAAEGHTASPSATSAKKPYCSRQDRDWKIDAIHISLRNPHRRGHAPRAVDQDPSVRWPGRSEDI